MGSGAGIDASPGAGTALAEAGDIALTAGGSAMQKEDVLKMQAAHEKYFSFGTTRVLQGIYARYKSYILIYRITGIPNMSMRLCSFVSVRL